MRLVYTLIFSLVTGTLLAQSEVAPPLKTAISLYQQGQVSQAYQQAQQSLTHAKGQSGVLSQAYADNLRLLALISASLGYDSLALQYTLQELESRKLQGETSSPVVVQAFRNASRLYLSLGDPLQAQYSVEQALTLSDSAGVSTETVSGLQLYAARVYQATQSVQQADSLYTLVQMHSLQGEMRPLALQARFYQALMHGALNKSRLEEIVHELRVQADTTTQFYAEVCYQLATFSLYDAEWQKAQEWYETALEVYEKDSLQLYEPYASLLNNLGNIALADNDAGVGARLIEKAYQQRSARHTYHQGSFWVAMANLAFSYAENGDLPEALALYNKHVHLEDTITDYPWEYAVVLNNLASIYQEEGNYERAGQLFSHALKVLYRNPVSEREALLHQAAIYSNAARNYQDLVRFDTAIYYHQKAIEIIKKTAGTQSAAYVAAISGIAALYHDIGYLVEADIFFNEALKVQKSLSGDQNNFYANLLSNYALVCQAQGDFTKAADLLEESIKIKEILLGIENPEYLAALSNIGLLYLDAGNYPQARPMLELVVDTQRERWGEEHPAMITSYLNLARLEITTGNYPEAEPLLQKAYRLSKAHFGSKHPEQAKVQLEMAKFYFLLGNFETAKPLLVESRAIFLEAYGATHPDLATADQSLAALYEAQDSILLAEQYYKEALSIDINTLGKHHPSYAATLSNLATLYQNNNQYNKALPLLEESLSISEGLLGKDHPFYSTTLLNLGLLYQDLQDYEKATAFIEEAVSIRRDILGEFHPDYAYALYSQAVLYHKLKKYEQAEVIFHQVVSNYIRQIQDYFPALSEQEKSAYFQRVEPVFHAFRDFVIDQVYYHASEVSGLRQQTLLSELYNLQLVTKAMLLDASYQLRRAIVEQSDSETIQLYEQWLTTKEQLAQLYTLSQQERGEQDADISSLEAKANQLEKDLSRRSETFATTVDIKRVTWQQVQKTLHPGEAAVEIIRVAKDSSTLYAALVVEPEEAAPRLCLLPRGWEMENKNYYYYQNAIEFRMADDLSYDLFWEPIQKQLSDQTKTVYLAPDGIYHKINLNSLYHPKTHQYVLDEIDLRVVSSTRDLVRDTKTGTSRQAYLIGYPDFQYQIGQYNSEAFQDTADTGSEPVARATMLENTPFLFGINQLPGTREEVQTIDELLTRQQWKTHKYVAEQAQEEAVKSVDNPGLLHIATHGYFMNDLPVSAEGGKAYGIHLQNITANPLLRAGLLLAGAEYTIRAEDGRSTYWEEEDGILTAYEAMNLRLNGTEMVVLSACETGLGDIKNGEGVYGLQRAFLVAGAQSVLMSLWNVNDNSTAELMKLFYQYWLSGQDKHQALRNAQLTIKKQRPDPYYWGGFMLIGK
uniref:Tetratricopeptide repeat protein n=1 Tax=Roseihalotalea indica TaxID=2867963 RepID=A0AA49GHH7_9BACT|nr:tetratricopeptide repeat protein [Tunicatimonas sp. TK19036]